MIPDRRGALAFCALSPLVFFRFSLGSGEARAEEAPLPVDRSAPDDPISYVARLRQGGALIGRTTPGGWVKLDGEIVTEGGSRGLFVIGFDRDAPTTEVLATQAGEVSLTLAPVAYSIQRIDGLPQDQVTPQDPALLARIATEKALKDKALATRTPNEDFAGGFTLPLDHALRTSAFGPQRILNGVPKTPHYGVDLAAPAGTPIHAPADGVVVLAEPDLWFEGGLTLIDHGQGLIGAFLHQQRLDVAPGQTVKRGEQIGLVGQKGRATGPHLCWRLTWRGRHLDPSMLLNLGFQD